MKKLFLGLFLTLLALPISLGGIKIDFLPDFAGYVLLALGFSQLTQCRRFSRLIPWAWILGGYTGALYILGLFSFPVQVDLVIWLLGLAGAVFGIVLRLQLVRGIDDLEKTLSRPLQADRLLLLWKFEAALCAVSYLLNWIPLVSAISQVASAIVAACFLGAFYRSWQLFEKGG